MAILICKGTVLQQDLASTLTTVAQIMSMSSSGMGGETFEADYLDQEDAAVTVHGVKLIFHRVEKSAKPSAWTGRPTFPTNWQRR